MGGRLISAGTLHGIGITRKLDFPSQLSCSERATASLKVPERAQTGLTVEGPERNPVPPIESRRQCCNDWGVMKPPLPLRGLEMGPLPLGRLVSVNGVFASWKNIQCHILIGEGKHPERRLDFPKQLWGDGGWWTVVLVRQGEWV